MKTVAVSGTHGKTTTTAMIADILVKARRNPNVIVGSLLSGKRGNYIQGDNKIFVVEACEYRRSFLQLEPFVLIITNIEADHLDYYKDLNEIIAAFNELALRVPSDGAIVCNPQDTNTRAALQGVGASVIDYTSYSVSDLMVPGTHNRKNAAAALAAARFLGVEEEAALKALKEFSGTWRRLEKRGETSSGAILYDDYAHHPTEIKASIEALKEKYPGKKLTVYFQPHLYSRTKELLPSFAEALGYADRVFVAPIYAARERDEFGISHHDLVSTIGKQAQALEPNSEEVRVVIKSLGGEDLFVTMGAGDVYQIFDSLTFAS
jgi:UDP-N-acetylmuramate--alanine ligase